MNSKRKYTGEKVQTQTFIVNNPKPLDDRFVIPQRAYLIDPTTWYPEDNDDTNNNTVVEGTSLMAYSGMIVSVTDDPVADNNGLYRLGKRAKADKQAWDETDSSTYDADGWKKIAGEDTMTVTFYFHGTFAEFTSSGDLTERYEYITDKTYDEIYNAVLSGKRVVGIIIRNSTRKAIVEGIKGLSGGVTFQWNEAVFANQTTLSHDNIISYSMAWLGDTIEDNDIIYERWVLTIYRAPEQLDIPTLRTMNHEQLTDNTLGDINIHDGYYFPNAISDYDGNWYGAIVIGDQVWLAENLRCTSFPDGTPISSGEGLSSSEIPYYTHCGSNPSNDEEYGLLYNWPAIMHNSPSSSLIPSGVQGIAPNGFHIPSAGEYEVLRTYLSKQMRFLADGVIKEPRLAATAKSIAYQSGWPTHPNEFCVGGEQQKNNTTGLSLKPIPNQYGQVWQIDLATSELVDNVNTHIKVIILNPTMDIIPIVRNTGTTNNNVYSYFSVRCVSDLSPVQFRNWYIEQYGSLQHHLIPIPTAADAGKVLMVNAQGQYELVSLS